jgi:hypothetical protein
MYRMRSNTKLLKEKTIMGLIDNIGGRQSYIGYYQPHRGGAVEQYYGHDSEEIYDQIHRLHGSFNIKNVRIVKGKHHD